MPKRFPRSVGENGGVRGGGRVCGRGRGAKQEGATKQEREESVVVVVGWGCGEGHGGESMKETVDEWITAYASFR